MKKIIIGLMVFCFFTKISFSQNPDVRTLPSADVKTVDGKTVNSSKFENGGKPIIISFWATWCKPCVKELNAISENYPDWQKETGVKVIIISEDDARTSSRAVSEVKTRGWTFESYLDVNQDFKRAMNVNNCPHTFLLNNNGEIIWQHNSYTEGDEDKLFDILKKSAKGEKIEE